MPRTVLQPKNGKPQVLTRDGVEQLLDREARAYLGVSGPEAVAMLDRGDLDGTIMQAEVSMLRGLLASK